jgi:hypothetical protein
MIAKIRFTQRIGDGRFGRLSYKSIEWIGEVRDFEHACIKARATMLKHSCLFNVDKALSPRAFITILGVRKQVYVNQQGGLEVLS